MRPVGGFVVLYCERNAGDEERNENRMNRTEKSANAVVLLFLLSIIASMLIDLIG